MARRKRGKLFFKFLVLFLLVSLGPLGVIGYYLINLTQISLKKESLRIQKSLAVGFADTVSRYVNTFKNVLQEAARLQDFATMSVERQRKVLNSLMQQHAAFIELSVIDITGQETVRIGRFLGEQPALRDFSTDIKFQATLRNSEYYGELERFMGSYPTMTMAIQILDPVTGRPNGIVMCKLSLNGLSAMLRHGFPAASRSQAAVVAFDGFLIAHSDPNRVFTPNARLDQKILDVILSQKQEGDRYIGGGEIELGTGERLLGAFSDVPDGLPWAVYIQKPLTEAYQTAREMLEKIYMVLVGVVVATLFLTLLVSTLITQPIRTLNEAAQRLSEGEFEDLPQLTMPNDEIGELAQTFQAMSESLKIKTTELIAAKEESVRWSRTLESRVEARTRELKAAQDELISKERLAAIGTMASVVGHEIRNPLAVINNSVYFIKSKLESLGVSEAKIEKHVKIVFSEIKQANSIIDEILTFTRTRELILEVQSLNEFMEDLCEAYPFPEHIKLVKEFSRSDPKVNIDGDEFRQAVRNLVGNAIEVMPKGGTLTLRTVDVPNDWVRIDVSDQGEGIPPEKVAKIFDAFFTTKARGTGLGLAVVKKVMDRHRGKVDVTSQVGRGTTFMLYLPLAVRRGGAPAAAPTA